MSALTGQLQPEVGPWGQKRVKRMQGLAKNPKDNLAQVQSWIKDWGAKGMEKYQPTPTTGATPTGGTTSNPVTDPVNTTTIKKESTGPTNTSATNVQVNAANGTISASNNNTTPPTSGNTTTPAGTSVTPPAEANGTTAAKPPYTPPAGTKENPGDPPAGILPGTPAYSAWLKGLPDAPPPPVEPAPGTGVTPDGGPAKPSGLTFKRGAGTKVGRPGRDWSGGGGIMKQMEMPDITITEEQLAKITPEQRKELEAISASGDGMKGLSALMMKYWGDPNMSELFQAIRKGSMGGATLKKGGLSGKVSMTPGNSGVKWMDKRYNDNMWAKDPNNPANQPQEPTPASGNGTWVQGPNGPIWQGGGPDPKRDPYGNPEGTLYAGGSPGWSTGDNRFDPNMQPPEWQNGGQQELIDFVERPGWYGGGTTPGNNNPYQQWMQQQFMQQYGMR